MKLLTAITILYSLILATAQASAVPRCGIVLQDNEFVTFKRISFKQYVPKGIYADTSFFDLPDETNSYTSDNIKVKQNVANKIKECINAGKKVNLFIFAHTNKHAVHVLGLLKAEGFNLQNSLEFVYNSGCADGLQGRIITKLGAESYVGHGVEGISCSPIFLKHFLPKLSFSSALSNDPTWLEHATSQANYQTKEAISGSEGLSSICAGSSRGRILGHKGRAQKAAKETHALLSRKASSGKVSLFKNHQLADLFPLQENRDLIEKNICFELFSYLKELYKKIVKKNLTPSLTSRYHFNKIKRSSNHVGLTCENLSDKGTVIKLQSYMRKKFKTYSFFAPPPVDNCRHGKNNKQIVCTKGDSPEVSISCDKNNKVKLTMFSGVSNTQDLEMALTYSSSKKYSSQLSSVKWLPLLLIQGSVITETTLNSVKVSNHFNGNAYFIKKGEVKLEKAFPIHSKVDDSGIIKLTNAQKEFFKNKITELYASHCNGSRVPYLSRCLASAR